MKKSVTPNTLRRRLLHLTLSWFSQSVLLKAACQAAINTHRFAIRFKGVYWRRVQTGCNHNLIYFITLILIYNCESPLFWPPVLCIWRVKRQQVNCVKVRSESNRHVKPVSKSQRYTVGPWPAGWMTRRPGCSCTDPQAQGQRSRGESWSFYW